MLRPGVLSLVFFLLASCGGDSTPPKPSVTYGATVPVTAVATLDGSATTDAQTFSWTLTSKPSGSSATIGNPTASKATLTPDVVGTYQILFTVSNGSTSENLSLTVTAVAYTPPTILSDIVEPVSGAVQLSLSTDPGTSTVTWTADGATVGVGTGATVTWDTTTVADGSHVVVAQLQATANYTVSVTRTFQVRQTTVSFTSATITESAGAFTALVGAQSVNGILSVGATLDGVAIGSLATPNACVDPTGVACASTGPNGYSFGGTVGSGQHVVVVTATDGIGNALGTQLRLNVTDVP